MNHVNGVGHWLQEHLTMQPTGTEGQYVANCPFCEQTGRTPDTRYHMGISNRPFMRAFHCFRCGASGSLIKLVKDLTGLSYIEARETVGLRRGFTDRVFDGEYKLSGTIPPAANIEMALPEEAEKLDPDRRSHSRAYKYLYDRGVTDDMIEAFKLQFCVTGVYGQRVVIPIFFEGTTIGFTARAVGDGDEPKYLFPSGFRAQDYLYNYDRAATSKFVVIVEGPFDAWRMPECAVALFTNNISDKQKLLIEQTWDRVVVMLDKDAQMKAYNVAKELAPYVTTSIAVLRSSKDPWEASPHEVRIALSAALSQTRPSLEVCV